MVIKVKIKVHKGELNMKNIIRRAALAILASSCVCVAPLMAQQEVSSHDLEKALMKYVLTYEAYNKAKQSTNKDVRANLPKYIRLYREAYAQYLELLRQAELYDPADKEKDNDPAGNFNRRQQSRGKSKQVWQPVNSSTQRAQVKKVIENGGSPDDVFACVKQNLPEKPISKSEEQILREALAAAAAAKAAEEGAGCDEGTGTNQEGGSKDTTTTQNTSGGGGNEHTNSTNEYN